MSRLPAGSVLSVFFLATLAPAGAGPQPGTANKQAWPQPTANSLPTGAVARLGGTCLRHDGCVDHLAFAADGKTLASLGQDHAIRLWDPATGRQRGWCALPKPGWGVRRMALSADGKRLAFVLDEAVYLWDADKGGPPRKPRWSLRPGRPVAFAFSADGKKIASWASDHALRIWDVSTGRQLTSFKPAPPSAVSQLALLPDGKTLATLSPDGCARLWDTATGKELRCWQDPGHPYAALALSPDGKVMAAGGSGEVRLWEAASGKALRRLAAPVQPPRVLDFAADGRSLTAVNDNGACRVWRVADGKELRRVNLVSPLPAFPGGLPDSIGNPTLSPDGNTVAWILQGRNNQIRLTDLQTGKGLPPRRPQPSGPWAAFAPDGKTVATLCTDRRLRLWDTATGNEVRAFAGKVEWLTWLAFSPDGKTLITVGKETIFWDTATGNEVRRSTAPRVRFVGHTCALSPEGKYLAVGEVARFQGFPQPDCRVLLWDLRTGKEVRSFQGPHRGSVTAVAFSPDGKRVASAGLFQTARIWEVATGREARRGRGTFAHSQYLAFADGGTSLLTFSLDSNFMGKYAARLVNWDLAADKPRRRFEEPLPVFLTFPAVFSPSGKRLASWHPGGGLVIWQTETGKMGRALRCGERGDPVPLAFSPDDGLLASWHDGDSTVLLWNAGEASGGKKK